MFIPSLHEFQIGLEAAVGDEGAGTIEPTGITNLKLNPKDEVEQLPQLLGDTMPAVHAFVKRKWSDGVIEGYLDYNRAMIWLDGMFGIDAASPHVYLGSLDWDPEVEQSLSLRYGQTGLIYLAGGVLPSELTISGASGEPCKFSYKFFGNDVSDSATFGVGVSADTPEFVMGTIATVVSVDNGLAVAPGTTPMTDLGFRFEWTVNCGREPVWHLGNQIPDAYKRGKWGGSMKLVLEADATLLAHLGDALDATVTPKSLTTRIAMTDATNALELDFAGSIVSSPTIITDLDGVVTVELELAPQYNSVMGSCVGAELTIA